LSGVIYRRRGTAIVETDRGILLTAGRPGKPFILPGGGAKRGESRFMAALRELTEETGLLPYAAGIIFKHKGEIRPTMSGRGKFQDHHTVCLVKASGFPRPGGGDATRIGYYYPGCNVWISNTTKEIIERYYEWKKNGLDSHESDIMDEEDGSDVGDMDYGSNNNYDDDE
jgi:8-oxo-dGTP diphosphatase